jgi:hypothetical protein
MSLPLALRPFYPRLTEPPMVQDPKLETREGLCSTDGMSL